MMSSAAALPSPKAAEVQAAAASVADAVRDAVAAGLTNAF